MSTTKYAQTGAQSGERTASARKMQTPSIFGKEAEAVFYRQLAVRGSARGGGLRLRSARFPKRLWRGKNTAGCTSIIPQSKENL
jgi:hypothetical protein